MTNTTGEPPHPEATGFTSISESFTWYMIFESPLCKRKHPFFTRRLDGALGVAATFLLNPIYTARTVFVPPQPLQSITSAAAAATAAWLPLDALTGSGIGRTPGDEYVSARAPRALQSSGFSQGAPQSAARSAEGYARLRAEITAAEVRPQPQPDRLAVHTPKLQGSIPSLSAPQRQLARLENSSQPAARVDNVSQFRGFKYQETSFELFAKNCESARVDESREGVQIQVVDPAIRPERRGGPKRAVIDHSDRSPAFQLVRCRTGLAASACCSEVSLSLGKSNCKFGMSILGDLKKTGYFDVYVPSALLRPITLSMLQRPYLQTQS
jgi:hypothetical protein